MAKSNDIRNSRLNVKVGKSVGLIVPVIFLFYLVLYLKESGLTTQSYFADYNNAVTVWTVGLNFFRTIMNTIDSVIQALGKLFNFVVEKVEVIINWIKGVIDGVGGVVNKSLFDRLVDWARNVIGNLMFYGVLWILKFFYIC